MSIETLTRNLNRNAPLRSQDNSKTADVPSLGQLEVEAFAPAWQSKREEQVVEEYSSHAMETRRIPDPYRFSILPNGELYSLQAGQKIKEAVARDSKVGELEYQALLKIEDWAKDRNSGAIIWVSPPEPGIYPTSKIIVSELEEFNGQKTLFNRAIVLDINSMHCLEFVRGLQNYVPEKREFASLDQIRSNPIVVGDKIHWSYVVEELLPGVSLEQVRSGEDIKIKSETLTKIAEVYSQILKRDGAVGMEEFVAETEKKGLIGEHGSSCPPKTAFQMFAENAKEVGSDCREIECTKCHWKPNAAQEKMIADGQLTACPECGWKPGG